MTAAPRIQHVSVEEYLAGELSSDVKHEYLGGFVYAMAGGRNVHNLIAGNVFARLHDQLRGRDCRPYNSDTKIRIKLPTHLRFYYPDVSVVCGSNPPLDSFQDRPVVLFEVISNSTRRIDFGEKKDAYLAIPSLNTYALVEQETPFVTLYRRTDDGFIEEAYVGLDSVIPLSEIDCNLPLAHIYEAVQFVPEPELEESNTR